MLVGNVTITFVIFFIQNSARCVSAEQIIFEEEKTTIFHNQQYFFAFGQVKKLYSLTNGCHGYMVTS